MAARDRPGVYVVKDLQQIKALADPLRQKILGAFVSEPRTTKQVATLLDQPPTKLYHHVDMLERAGLIELAATKPKRGTTEKYFRAVASRFTIAEDSLGGEGAAVLDDAVTRAFASAQAEMRKAVEAGPKSDEGKPPRMIVALGSLRIAPEQLPELQKRITEIANDLGSASQGSEKEFYRYLVAVYPSTEEVDN